MARGSLTETYDHLIVALDEKIITDEILQAFQQEYESCLRLINGYIQYLKTKKSEGN